MVFTLRSEELSGFIHVLLHGGPGTGHRLTPFERPACISFEKSIFFSAKPRISFSFLFEELNYLYYARIDIFVKFLFP